LWQTHEPWETCKSFTIWAKIWNTVNLTVTMAQVVAL
jgi:hypothetical protein